MKTCPNTGLECDALSAVISAEYVMLDPEFTSKDALALCEDGVKRDRTKAGQCPMVRELIGQLMQNGLVKPEATDEQLTEV